MIWSIIAYIVIGFLGGSIAKAVVPGKQGGGFWKTVTLGVVGAFVGGFLGGLLLDKSYTNVFSISGLICSIVGALILLFVFGLVDKKKS